MEQRPILDFSTFRLSGAKPSYRILTKKIVNVIKFIFHWFQPTHFSFISQFFSLFSSRENETKLSGDSIISGALKKVLPEKVRKLLMKSKIEPLLMLDNLTALQLGMYSEI